MLKIKHLKLAYVVFFLYLCIKKFRTYITPKLTPKTRKGTKENENNENNDRGCY